MSSAASRLEPAAAAGAACARASLARGEPLRGTASFFDVWLLLVSEARSARDLRASLPPAYLRRQLEAFQRRQRTGQGGCVRTLGIRQGRVPPRPDGRIEAFVAVPRPQRLFRLELPGPEALVDLDFDALRRGEPGPAAEPVSEPMVAVCTDGKVDPCCAREGMRTYRALERQAAESAWRVTHLGGCRFASNVITFPDCTLYGRVGPDDVAGVLRAARSGRIAREHFRGRALLDPEANAAETALRNELGEWRVDALELVDTASRGERCVDFHFRRDDGRIWRVSQTSRPADEAFLTCRAADPTAAIRYEVLAIGRC